MASRASCTNLGKYLKLWKCPPVLAVTQDGIHGQHTCSKWPHDVKPVVLMLPWLNAGVNAVGRYRQLYHNYGLDVITVNIDPQHFLWPPLAKNITEELTRYFTDVEKDRLVLVHSFSLGSYLYSVWLSEFLDDCRQFAHIKNRICGQVFDSITIGGLAKMAEGVGRGLSTNDALQRLVKGTLMLYFALSKNVTVKSYDKYIEAFWNNPVKSPILFFYCWNDPMSDGTEVEKVIACLQEGGNKQIVKKDWERSRHAGHLKEHREDYVQVFDEYMTLLVKDVSESHLKANL